MTALTRSRNQGAFAARLSDLRGLYRRHGLRTLASKAWARLKASVYSTDEVVVLAKDLREITDMAFAGSLRIEELGDRHIPALRRFNTARNDAKASARAEQDIRRGYRGYAGFAGDELVGYYWWVDRGIEPRHRDIADYGLHIDLADRDVYGFDFFLLEEYRGGGNSMEFLYKVETGLRDLGYRTLYGYVVEKNKPARWLYAMRGYVPVREVGAKRVLGRRVETRVEPRALMGPRPGAAQHNGTPYPPRSGRGSDRRGD